MAPIRCHLPALRPRDLGRDLRCLVQGSAEPELLTPDQVYDRDEDIQVAVNQILHGRGRPSRLVLPVIAR